MADVSQQENGISVAQIVFPVEDRTDHLAFLTLREMAEILHISQRTVLLMARRKELPGFKCGSRWRIRESELAKWLEEIHER